LELDTRERRLELLKLEGMGFSRPEIVKELSMKYHCTERAVYYDFETRNKWQRFDDEEAVLRILNRFEYLYRTASFNLMSAERGNIKVAWVRVMLEVNKQLAEKFVIPNILTRLKTLEERARGRVFL